MAFFSKTPEAEVKVRRPVAEIVSGFTTMVSDLDEAREMAAAEQRETEMMIERLVNERNILLTEQARATMVASNIRDLLSTGLDGDGDGEPDELSALITGWRNQQSPEVAPATEGDE